MHAVVTTLENIKVAGRAQNAISIISPIVNLVLDDTLSGSTDTGTTDDREESPSNGQSKEQSRQDVIYFDQAGFLIIFITRHRSEDAGDGSPSL